MAMGSMSIRKRSGSDLSALMDLYAHLHASDLPRAAPQLLASVWDSIQQNDAIRYFGVFDDTSLIGSCNITIIPNLTRGCAPYGLVENVVTHKAHRGRGHGKAMLRAALDFAWSRRCYKVMLMTGRLDEGIYGFYEKAGFKRHRDPATGEHSIVTSSGSLAKSGTLALSSTCLDIQKNHERPVPLFQRRQAPAGYRRMAHGRTLGAVRVGAALVQRVQGLRR